MLLVGAGNARRGYRGSSPVGARARSAELVAAELVAIQVAEIGEIGAGHPLAGRALAGPAQFDGLGVKGVDRLAALEVEAAHRAVADAGRLAVIGAQHAEQARALAPIEP